nr:unnamed protein product [Callosobruchus chinensis]
METFKKCFDPSYIFISSLSKVYFKKVLMLLDQRNERNAYLFGIIPNPNVDDIIQVTKIIDNNE